MACLVCRYVMFYEAVAEDDRRSISLAVSRDGIKDWQCLGSAILTAGGSSAWDAGGVGSPCAVSMEGATSAISTTNDLLHSLQWYRVDVQHGDVGLNGLRCPLQLGWVLPED